METADAIWRRRDRRARARRHHSERPARPGCTFNETAAGEALHALPRFFLRHWEAGSVSFKHAQQTYNSLAGWGQSRLGDAASTAGRRAEIRSPLLGWEKTLPLPQLSVAPAWRYTATLSEPSFIPGRGAFQSRKSV